MRIAYISYEYPPDSGVGGIATYVAQAAQMMVRRGHQVEVFASSPCRNGRADLHGVVVHWIRESDRHDFGVIAGHAFAARHAEESFDVLEGPEFYADARKAIELVPDIPLVVKMHTPSLVISTLNAPSGFGPYFAEIRRNFRALISATLKARALRSTRARLNWLNRTGSLDIEAAHAKRADVVAPPCGDLCTHASAVWNIPEKRIRLSPHPFTPPKDFLALRPRAEGFTVGFVGRLEKRKGIETLAAAIPSVLNSVPEAKFRFVGAPVSHPESGIPYDDWIRRKVHRHVKHLEFTGKVAMERMAEAYGSLDICVFPSSWENFPNVCLEAMSAGRAIIASSAGGMSEILDRGKAGRLVTPGDSTALAREMIALLRNPTERVRLGEMARNRVLSAYNETVIGEIMEGIYLSAIASRNQKRGSFASV